jgi:hypothetical protein
MKKFTLIVAVLFLAATLTKAQTVAQNWTKTDCAGNTHTLFDDLNGGKVVLMQFDMMNCTFCTGAAYHTDQILKDYGATNPGKVLMYSMGYSNTTVCSDMKSWVSTNKFSFPVIEKCPNDVAYYGGMGMPTIVIAGGWGHTVYYKKQGYAASDDADIRAAINAALARSAVDESINIVNKMIVYPNPANKMAHIEYTLAQSINVNIEVYNMLGSRVQTLVSGQQIAGDHTIDLNTDGLSNGMYFAKINGNTVKFQVSN